MKKKKNTFIYAIAFLCFAGALGYLCFAGFSENSVYFLNVAEARASAQTNLANARLFGVVDGEGLEKGINTAVFRLLDKDDPRQAVPVAYSGLVPDTFRAGAEVIVEGGMGQDGLFTARTLMTKCPSKYKKENRQI